MKILDIAGTDCHVVGLVCDCCQQRISIPAPPDSTGVAPDAGPVFGGPMTLDIRNAAGLHRADFCSQCTSEFVAQLVEFLPRFQQVCTVTSAQNSPPVYRYQSIDAATGQVVETTSLFDEDSYRLRPRVQPSA